MGRTLLPILFICLSFFQAKAQIPNNDFESWKTVTNPLAGGTFEEPEGWFTTNVLAFYGAPLTVTKSTDKNSGTYAMKVESKAYFDNETQENDTLDGFAMCTFPFKQRLTSLNGFYKCAPLKDDFVNITVMVLKNINGQSSYIGGGEFSEGVTVNTYKSFSINIDYIMNEAPDSVMITVSSSENGAAAGSFILLDNLSLSLPTSVDIPLNLEPLQVFPNPVESVLFINNIHPAAKKIEVFNARGEKVKTSKISSENVALETEDLSSGLHMYSIFDSEGVLYYKGRFIVK